MRLRPYQRTAIGNVAAGHRDGHHGILLVAPTGGGKTVIFSAIARSLVNAGRSVLIVTPAVELVEQTRDKLLRLGVERCGVIAAGWSHPAAGGGRPLGYNPDPTALVQVATVQTLRNRPRAMVTPPHYIIFDEAHLAAAKSYRMVCERYPRARRLGVTATPWRLDGQGFRSLASLIVVVASVPELQALGNLTQFRTLSIPMTAYARSQRRPSREFNQRAMAADYVEAKLVGDMAEHYAEHAAGRTSLVFAASVAHSMALRDEYRAAGYAFEHLDGTTPLPERKAMLAALDAGQITGICNFGVLTAGFDCPRVSCVQIGRATASKALWIQMAGRGLRPFAGKTDCLVLDHGGNALRHGNLAHRHQYTLEGRELAESLPSDGVIGKTCPDCLLVLDRTEAICPQCGHDFTARDETLPEVAAGRLVAVGADAAPIDDRPKETQEQAAARRGRWSRRAANDRARSWAERMRASR